MPARATRTCPRRSRLTNFDEAYAAQEALCALWEPRLGPIAGRKIAVTTKVMQELMGIDHPCGGMIFASRVHRSPGPDRQGRLRECAHRVRAGGAARPRPAEGIRALHARERARRRCREVMAAFELIEDRNADYKTCKALSLIADNAWNGGIVMGAPRRRRRARSQRHRGSPEAQRQGGAVRQDGRSDGRARLGRQPRRIARPADHGGHGRHYRQSRHDCRHCPRRAARFRHRRRRRRVHDGRVEGR